ncbi:MAG: MFS transporter [Acidimicrobiales bacterium]
MSRLDSGPMPDGASNGRDGLAGSPRQVLALVLGFSAMALLPVGVTGANLAFPEIEAEFDDASRATLSWALSGYSITIAAFTLLGGHLADRFTASRMFRVGLTVFVAASLVAAAAPSAAVLIAGRCLQGMGGAFLVSSSLLVVTHAWPRAKHVLVIGVWTAAFPIGAAIAPALTAMVLEVADWRWIFVLTAALGTGIVVGHVFFLPATPGRTSSDQAVAHPDYVGIIIGTLAVGLIALGIVQGPTWGWTSWRVLGALATGVALIPVFIWRSKRHSNPLVDMELFRIRTYSLASVSNLFISIAGMSVWLLWPLLMANEWGFSQIEVGLALTPTPLLAGAGSLVTAKIAGRHGYRVVLLVGLALLVAANLWFFATLEPDPNFVGAMLPGMLLYGVGMGLCFAPINAAALVDVDPGQYSEANAAFSTGRFLAAAIGIATVVAALGEAGSDPFAGFDRAFLILGGLSLAGFITLAIGWPRKPHTT